MNDALPISLQFSYKHIIENENFMRSSVISGSKADIRGRGLCLVLGGCTEAAPAIEIFGELDGGFQEVLVIVAPRL